MIPFKATRRTVFPALITISRVTLHARTKFPAIVTVVHAIPVMITVTTLASVSEPRVVRALCADSGLAFFARHHEGRALV